jgi:hypothetical protein
MGKLPLAAMGKLFSFLPISPPLKVTEEKRKRFT